MELYSLLRGEITDAGNNGVIRRVVWLLIANKKKDFLEKHEILAERSSFNGTTQS